MTNRKTPAPQKDQTVDTFLKKLAATPQVKVAGQRGRLIFAMDATASRQASWDQACQIQAQMFSSTAALGGLAIQLCFYRGFNEFQALPWQSSSQQLLNSMAAVSCRGGHSQIEKVLQQALTESQRHKINALVFIGDAVEEDVDRLSQLAGKLGLLGVPVFVFHEGHDPVAAHAFKNIAQLSKGAYCHFDSGSAQQLRDLLSAVAVYAAGGQQALNDLSQRSGSLVKQLTRQLERK